MTTEVEGTEEGVQIGDPENTTQVATRPDNVPEKFWNAETGAVNTDALIASYAELEKARSKPREAAEGDPVVPTDEGTETPPVVPHTTAYTAAVEKATAELAEGGALTDETYAAFEGQGITREQVDLYVEGQHARFEIRKVYAEREAGGEENYKALLEWAGSNYTPEDAEAFNNTVFGADRDNAMTAVRTLKTRYEDAMGTEGKIVTDGTGSATSGGYADKTEWMADLRKPEYKKDAKFRDAVRKKLEASMKSGVDMGVGIGMG